TSDPQDRFPGAGGREAIRNGDAEAAARHIPDGDDDRLPFFVRSLRYLLVNKPSTSPVLSFSPSFLIRSGWGVGVMLMVVTGGELRSSDLKFRPWHWLKLQNDGWGRRIGRWRDYG
ncbi:unnamed protein product, partial [Urochloa humidicola]